MKAYSRPTVALVIAAAATSIAVAAQPSLATPSPAGSTVTSDGVTTFFVINDITSQEQRDVISASGVAVEAAEPSRAVVEATTQEADVLREAGLVLEPMEDPGLTANRRVADVAAQRAAQGEVTAQAEDFPSGDEAYHTYDEVNAELNSIAQSYPDIAQVFDIGQSHEGRTIYGLKISDNIAADEGEPEVLQNCNIHAREHLTAEMCMYMVNEFTSKYSTDQDIRDIVDNQVLWIIPMLNPDGAMYDIENGEYRTWRKNRQPGQRYNGVDLNRNFAYEWGCCGGSSGNEQSETYRGDAPESGIEVKRLTDFVRSRRTSDGNKIKSYIDWHSYSELIMWPFGYTKDRTATDMTEDEAAVFETLGKAMAHENGYKPTQLSGLYVADGSSADWMWGSEGIWGFAMEMYPAQGGGRGGADGFYPPGSVIEKQTTRNRGTVMTFLENTDCMWRVIGQDEKCGDDTTPPAPAPTSAPTPAPVPTTDPTPSPEPTTEPEPSPEPDKPSWPWPWPLPWPLNR